MGRINRTVADALNGSDAKKLRDGYSLGVSNSRGVRVIDGTGTTEDELAQKYKLKADDTENAGYHIFAETLRRMSNSYSREAAQTRHRHAE